MNKVVRPRNKSPHDLASPVRVVTAWLDYENSSGFLEFLYMEKEMFSQVVSHS
jgi:hypothetical protein